MAAKTCTILKEALAIPGKNPKLISPLFLIAFLVNFLNSYATGFSVHSLDAGLMAETPATSLRPFIILQLVLAIVFMVVTPVLMALDIYALAMTHAGKQLTLRELLREAKPAIGRSVATQFLILFPATVVWALASSALVMLWWRVDDDQIVLLGLIVVVGVAGWALTFWLTTLWAVTSTVTVMEERWGVTAVKRAAEVVRGGMWTAVSITVTASGASTVIGLASSGYVLKTIAGEMGVWEEVGGKAVYYLAIEAIHFVMLGAFAVFYSEKKRSREEGAQGMTVAVEGGFYVKLPTADVI